MDKSIAESMILWYRVVRRDLPWRRDRNPYHVWLAEIMLQQTRIEAVIPYYERFLAAFPNVRALADAPEEKVLKLWEGLGYYSRARNLQKAARIVAQKGDFPREAKELRMLPGIGEYTAGAIASIAFGMPEPAVDGNVLRVLARIDASREDVLLPLVRKKAAQTLREIYPSGEDAGDLTEGLMELGERVCLPNAAPLCDACPVKDRCKSHAAGNEQEYPVRSVAPEKKTEKITVFILSHQGRYAIRRRPERGLLAGLWEFINAPGALSQKAALEFLQNEGFSITSFTPLPSAKHVFTHRIWQMHGFRAETERKTEGLTWATADELREQYALPTAFRPFLKQIKEEE